MNNQSELITLKEAARRLSVCRTTVYRLAWSGKLRLFRIGTRSTRIRLADLENLLTSASEIELRPPAGARGAADPAEAA